MENTFSPGTEVRYTSPVDANEAAMVFVVLEDRGDRVLIEYRQDPNQLIFPTTCISKIHLETMK